MTDATRVLIVEDDPQIRAMLAEYLAPHGFEVTAAGSGAEMRARLDGDVPDVVLLDVALPGEDGLSIARYLRERHDVAIIMVTGASDVVDRVAGLEVGADDYVTKPFGIGELVARIRVALRHSVRVRSGEQLVVLDDADIDLERRRARRHGVEVHLTPIEFRLVATLAKHMGLVVAHRQLLREVWGPTHEDDTHYLRIYMKQLREKLEVDPAKPRHFLTELGVGYRLEPKE